MSLGTRERERDSAIGVILAFGLGVGVLLLGYYHGFSTAATNILFGNIFGVSYNQLGALVAIGVVVMIVMAFVFRPLLFASVDADVATARGVPVRRLGFVFLIVLALTVTAAAQVVGTLLVLSLAITPAAAAQRWSPNPITVTVLSIGFALVAADGGILASLGSTTIKPSVFVTSISFALYVVSRIVGPRFARRRRRAVPDADCRYADYRYGRDCLSNDEERIALFLDYENLAIGAQEQLHLAQFDFRPVADALAERGRVVVRRAYADWSRFDEDRRMLTRHHVELIEIPQRMGSVRKNAADIKMAVDAIELCFERDYITTFVLGTGDSDFTPLVHKLRELNRRVIGIGVEASTSALLPPACDEFLFYERLEGVEPVEARRAPSRSTRTKRAPAVEKEPVVEEEQPTARGEEADLGVLVTQTLSGLSRSAGGPVLASMLKRAILRKDPTFSETTYGFRGLLGAAAPPRGARARRADPRAGPGRSRGELPDRGRRRAGRVRVVAQGRRPAHGEVGTAAPVGAEDPVAQGRARLQREAVRLRRVPAVLQGRPGPRPDRDGLGRRRRRLHRPVRRGRDLRADHRGGGHPGVSPCHPGRDRSCGGARPRRPAPGPAGGRPRLRPRSEASVALRRCAPACG